MFKKESGITLIALVITIIVLLILAGVTIAMLTGENGLLSRATSTKEASDIGTAKELISLHVNNKMSEYYEKKYVLETATATDTLEKAATDGITAAQADNSWPANVTIASGSNAGEYDMTYTPNGNKITFTVNSSTGAVAFP